MKRTKFKRPWWGEGLAFECTRCGHCCTGAPGFVWVDTKEIRKLAARVGTDPETFGRRYLRRVGDRISLIERTNGDCIFYRDGEGCTVYEDRPLQCRTYPYWPEVVRSRADWESEGRRCPGIDKGTVRDPYDANPDLVRFP
ncbi:MAG: YkgJ family cysteine cluster protein [Planctomycetota bacterium]